MSHRYESDVHLYPRNDMNIEVAFIVTMLLTGQRPVVYRYPVEDLARCLYEVHEFAAKPSHEALIKGGEILVGCAIRLKPSEEH